MSRQQSCMRQYIQIFRQCWVADRYGYVEDVSLILLMFFSFAGFVLQVVQLVVRILQIVRWQVRVMSSQGICAPQSCHDQEYLIDIQCKSSCAKWAIGGEIAGFFLFKVGILCILLMSIAFLYRKVLIKSIKCCSKICERGSGQEQNANGGQDGNDGTYDDQIGMTN